MEPRHVIAGAGAAIVVGAWGTWMTVRSGFGQIDLSGLETDDGKLTAGLGAVVIVIALARMADRTRAIVAGLASAAAAVVAGLDYADLSNRAEQVSSEYVRASVGWGLWLVIVAGIIGVGASISAWPKRSDVSPAAPGEMWAPPSAEPH